MPDEVRNSSVIPDDARRPGAPGLPPGRPHPGEECIDLVCHDVVRLSPETPRIRWGDDTFFFCSTFCRRRFAVSPAAHLAGSANYEHSTCTGGKNAAA